jgi:hypothetical protein
VIGVLRRWRARRECFHHNCATGESFITGRLVDLGRRKLFTCRECGRRWIA